MVATRGGVDSDDLGRIIVRRDLTWEDAARRPTSRRENATRRAASTGAALLQIRPPPPHPPPLSARSPGPAQRSVILGPPDHWSKPGL
jgi:hypothetical protein